MTISEFGASATIRSERNIKSTQHVAYVLHELFPRRIKTVHKVKSIYTYEEDKISKILGGDSTIVAQLSKKDIQTISEISALLDNREEYRIQVY